MQKLLRAFLSGYVLFYLCKKRGDLIMFSNNFHRNALALLSLLMLGYSQGGIAAARGPIDNSCGVMERVCPCGKTASCTESCDKVCNGGGLSWLVGDSIISVYFNGVRLNNNIDQFLDRYRRYGNNDPLYHYECYGAICSSLSAKSGSLLVSQRSPYELVKLTATPDSGYSFLGWYGSCSGNSFETTAAASKVSDCRNNQLPIPPATITGKVFNDLNGNGVRDANEQGLANWVVTSNVLVNNKNQDSKGNTYNRTTTTNAKGEYTLGTCNPQKDANGQYNATEVQKCLTLPGWYTVGIEQKAGWTSTTPNPFEKFDLNASVSAANTIDYESYAGLEFGVFNGYILKTTIPTNGTISSSDSKINCSNSSKLCQAGFPAKSSVTLKATPATGYLFSQWGGSCSGTNPTLTLTMDASKSCSATFVKSVLLNVGINSGDNKMNMNTIKSQPTGISCSVGGFMTPDCKEEYPLNQVVTLTATSSVGYVFKSWSGACTGNALTTTVKMDVAKTCTANFAPAFNLTVSKTGNGSISGTGINCGTDCSESIAANTNVTLTATPSNGSYFSNWTGACTGTASTCIVTMNQAKTVSALFKPLVAKTSSAILNAYAKGAKSAPCDTQSISVCLPVNCQLDKSGNHLNGYIESRGRFDNYGGKGVFKQEIVQRNNQTCLDVAVEVCPKNNFWAWNRKDAAYNGTWTIYGLCKQ